MTEATPFLQKYDITFLRPPSILPGQFLIIQIILFLSDVAFCFQCFSTENSSACSTSYSVVGKSYEFVIVNLVLTETSDRYAHAIFIVDILAYLRTVVFFEILNKMLRCTRKF